MSTCIQQPRLIQSTFSKLQDPTTVTIIVLTTLLPIQIFLFIFICMYNRYNKKFTIQPSPEESIPNNKRAQKNKEVEKNNKIKVRNAHQYQDSANRFQIYNRFNNKNMSYSHHRNKNMDEALETPNQSRQRNNLNKQSSENKSKDNPQTEKTCLRTLIFNIQQFLSKYTSKNKLKICTFISILFAVASIIFMIVSLVSSQQALNRQFIHSQCVLNSTTSQFVNGNQNWVGLSYIVPNLTKLQLNLNTRVKATRNSLTSLLLNGTNTTFPIGFPNGTSIPSVISGTVVSRSVQTFVQARLRQWLFMNSTLSGAYRFPICQNSSISNIPHPLNDNTTIQLNYMNSICSNLTQEVNLLVANARAADDMLTLTTNIQNTRQVLNNNINSHSSSLSGIALRSKQYSSTFSSSNQVIDGQRVVPYVMLTINIISFVLLVAYFIFQFQRFKKYTDHKQQYIQLYNQNDPENPLKFKSMKVKVTNKRLMIQAQNLSLSDASELSPQELRMKKKTKIKQILRSGLFAHSKFTYFINSFYLITIFVIGFSTISFIPYINKGIQSCQVFRQINQGKNISQINQITNIQSQLITPIQTCVLKSSNKFLQTADTPTQLRSIQQLYKMSLLYNNTTPISLLNSTSLQQIQVLKGYLLHMQTMPIKAQDFTLQTLIEQLNTYSNGSSLQSRQKIQCGTSVLRDQYIYNVQDCKFNLINYLNQTLTTEPRCLQIPTYDGTGGSKEADLNDAQHTIQLNTTCPTVYEFYNGTNTGCFLGKRLALLRSANCISTAAEYNRRLRNLLKFSVQTASYTNAYMQNLRNYFGVYSVLSTNMTQFFNGVNTSQIVNQFGTLTNNIINRTSCSYVKQSIQDIYNSYCPSQNSITMLLYDSYAWMFISFGIISLTWISLIIWQMLAKTFMRLYLRQIGQNQSDRLVFNLPNRFFQNNKIANEKVEKKDMSIQQYKRAKIKKLQLTEQTLRNQNTQENQNQRQYINKFKMIERQDSNFKNKNKIRKQKMIQNSKQQQRQKDQIENIQIQILQPPSKRQTNKQNKQNSEESQYSKHQTQQFEAKYQKEKLTQKKVIQKQQTEEKKETNEQSAHQVVQSNKNENLLHQSQKKINQLNVEQSKGDKIQKQKTSQKSQKEQKQRQFKMDSQQQNYQLANQKNIFEARHRQEQQQNEQQTIQRATKYKQSSIGYNRKGQPLQIELTQQNEQNDHKQYGIKKSPRFFESLDNEVFKQQKARNQESKRSQRQRKVQSINQIREQNKNKNSLLKKKNNSKSIAKITKQARQNQRLKTVQMNQILNQTIDFVDLRAKQEKKQ